VVTTRPKCEYAECRFGGQVVTTRPDYEYPECRGVYMSDSILVDLGICMVAFHGGECEFRFLTFLKIVN